MATRPSRTPGSAALTVHVTGVNDTQGVIIVTVYDSVKNFLRQESREAYVRPRVDGDAIAVFDRLRPGKYAVTVVYDKNNNGELDQNFIGWPLERYAFSTGYRPKLRAPRFDEVSFPVDGPTTIDISLP